MNYYEKYLKYKKKYLYLKGGKPVEPFTLIEYPDNPRIGQENIWDQTQVTNFFINLNNPRSNNQNNEDYYRLIQSPLKERLIRDRIDLGNLRNYLQQNLEEQRYINIASYPAGDSTIFVRKNNGILEFYMFYDEQNQDQEPENSGLARFLRPNVNLIYRPSNMFGPPQLRGQVQG